MKQLWPKWQNDTGLCLVFFVIEVFGTKKDATFKKNHFQFFSCFESSFPFELHREDN